MINLPLGSFRRDEVYTFLGGLFVTTFWLLFRNEIFETSSVESNEFKGVLWLLFIWLVSTLLIYFINTQLRFIQYKIVDRKINNLQPADILRASGLENQKLPVYYDKDVYDDGLMNIHIDTVIFSSFVITLLPFFVYKFIYYTNLPSCSNSIGYFLILLLLAIFFSWLLWSLNKQLMRAVSLNMLQNKFGEVLFYDLREVAKLTANHCANRLMGDFNLIVQQRNPPTTAPPSPIDPLIALPLEAILKGVVSSIST